MKNNIAIGTRLLGFLAELSTVTAMRATNPALICVDSTESLISLMH
jgi:hypothetical protein